MSGRLGCGWITGGARRIGCWSGLLALLLAIAPVGAAEDKILDVVYQGIPHDALFDLCFDGDKGLAVGVAGAVLHTEDAGVSWQADKKPLTEKALLGVSCGGGNAVAVGQGGHIQVRKADGSWQVADSGTDQRILSVEGNSNGLLVAVGGFGTILRSRDSGASWEPLMVDWEAILNDFLEPHIYDVVVFDDNTVIVVGEFELVLMSVDAGDSWEVVNKADASLAGIFFSDRQTGYAVGQKGKVIGTVDGGLTWRALDVDARENLLDVWASGNDIYIPGIRTLLRSRDGGASWESITEGDISVKWYQSIKGTRTATGYNVAMVGHSGRIIQIKH